MKISIIIPAYNVEAYIEKCINSVINQTYDDIEVIIIMMEAQITQQRLLKNILK